MKNKRVKILLVVMGLAVVGLGLTLASSGSLFQGALSLGSRPNSVPIFATDTDMDMGGGVQCPTHLETGEEVAVYCFDVTASDEGPIELYKLTFSAVPDLLDEYPLSRPNRWTVYEADDLNTPIMNGSWAGDEVVVTAVSSAHGYISAGTTRHFILKAPIEYTVSDELSSISVYLIEDTERVRAGSASRVPGHQIWSDTTDTSHSWSTEDWINGYQVEGLPTDAMTLEELPVFDTASL